MCTLAYRNDDFDNLVFLIGAFGRCDDVFFGCNATNLKTVSVDPLQKRYIAVDHIAVFPHVNCSSGQETSERSNDPAGGSFFRRILCRFGRSRTCRIFVDTNPQLQIAIFQNELFQQIVVIRCNGCAGAVESGCLTLVLQFGPEIDGGVVDVVILHVLADGEQLHLGNFFQGHIGQQICIEGFSIGIFLLKLAGGR